MNEEKLFNKIEANIHKYYIANFELSKENDSIGLFDCRGRPYFDDQSDYWMGGLDIVIDKTLFTKKELAYIMELWNNKDSVILDILLEMIQNDITEFEPVYDFDGVKEYTDKLVLKISIGSE